MLNWIIQTNMSHCEFVTKQLVLLPPPLLPKAGDESHGMMRETIGREREGGGGGSKREQAKGIDTTSHNNRFHYYYYQTTLTAIIISSIGTKASSASQHSDNITAYKGKSREKSLVLLVYLLVLSPFRSVYHLALDWLS